MHPSKPQLTHVFKTQGSLTMCTKDEEQVSKYDRIVFSFQEWKNVYLILSYKELM